MNIRNNVVNLKDFLTKVNNKTDFPRKYPNTTQFVTGVVGATRAQFCDPCKTSENHKFNCPMRNYLHNVLKPFRKSSCPITRDIADMIHGNNVYQDILEQPIQKESVKGFFWQLIRIEGLLKKAYKHDFERADEVAKSYLRNA